MAIVSIKNSISKKFEEVTDREKVVRLCSTKHRYIYIYVFRYVYAGKEAEANKGETENADRNTENGKERDDGRRALLAAYCNALKSWRINRRSVESKIR